MRCNHCGELLPEDRIFKVTKNKVLFFVCKRCGLTIKTQLKEDKKDSAQA